MLFRSEGISNFFGRFDPRAQMLDNTEDMNTLARTTTVTSGPPVVTEHTERVMLPPSAHDLPTQNIHAEVGPTYRFDSEAGPSNPQGSYRSYLNPQQTEANFERMPQPLRPVPIVHDRTPMARPPITTKIGRAHV